MNDITPLGTLEQAISLQNAGSPDEAKKIFHRIIALEPTNVAALYSLAVLLYNQDQADEALAYIEKAISLRGDVDYFYETKRAITTKIKGSKFNIPQSSNSIPSAYPEVVSATQYGENNENSVLSITLDRNKVKNLSEVVSVCDQFLESGKLEHAIFLYRDYIHRNESDSFLAKFNLGAIYSSLNEQGLAAACYEDIIKAAPNFVPAYMNLGTIYEKASKPKLALETWSKALALPDISLPKNTEDKLKFLNNLGRLSEIERQYDKAEAYLFESLKVDPTQSPPLQHWFHLRQKQYKWPILTNDDFCKKPIETIISPLASLAFVQDPATQRASSQRFVRDTVKTYERRVARTHRYRHDKIKIGYASSDLSMHAVSLLTVELFEKHDRSKFEIHAFCWSPEDGTPFRQRVKSAFDHFHPIGALSDDEAADLIQAEEIDILFDLQGLSGRARPNLIAQGAAPIQIAYLGFPGTTCLPHVDYVIADRFLFPENLKPHFSETPVYLETVFQVSDSHRQFGPERPRLFYGIPENKFVFCSFNNAYKYTPQMIEIWSSILQNVPDSILWLLEDNVWSKENILIDFESRGVDPSRIYFAGRIDPRDYLSRFKAADIFLDTYPYNAGTTANDALFAGLPVLTLSGQTYVSRMAGALVNRLGIPELIATDLEQYKAAACEFAQDRDLLTFCKEKIKAKRDLLFDIAAITKDLENKLIKLVEAE